MHALVIAVGEGQRLRLLTDDRPKGMVAVAGKPILQHQIEWLNKALADMKTAFEPQNSKNASKKRTPKPKERPNAGAR
jgi:dTDP-glucose pyrophosphorylase